MRPPMAAALDDIKPYVVTAGVVALFGTPAEIAVPVVRRLRHRSGVSIGPGMANLVNGIVALGVAHYVRQRPAQWQRWKHKPIPRWGRIAGVAYLTVSPAAAAGWKRGVILPRRTPLWGGLISPIGLLQITLVIVAISRAGRARSSEVTGAPEDDAGANPRAAHP
jgi:hypothetical protein